MGFDESRTQTQRNAGQYGMVLQLNAIASQEAVSEKSSPKGFREHRSASAEYLSLNVNYADRASSSISTVIHRDISLKSLNFAATARLFGMLTLGHTD
jgi:hypothetical protein